MASVTLYGMFRNAYDVIKYKGLVAILLAFQILIQFQTILFGYLNRFLTEISPVSTEIGILAALAYGEYVDLTLLFVSPIVIGLLYFSVFFDLIQYIYPESLQAELENSDTLWRFKFVISFHALVTYLFGVLFIPLYLETGLVLGRSMLYDPQWWFNGGTLGYAIFGPFLTGYILSSCDDGIRSYPSSDSAVFAFTEGLSSENISEQDKEHGSPVMFWVDQGVFHTLPAFGLGLMYISFNIVYPMIEILLAIGVIATLSPIESFPPGSIDEYDIETQIAEILVAFTANIKGLITSLSIFASSIISLFSFKLSIKFLLNQSVERTSVIVQWNRLGFLLCLFAYTVCTLLLCFSLSSRLPWFISKWSSQYHTYEGRELEYHDNPRRFGIGLFAISGLWILFSLSSIESKSVVYAASWPMFLVPLLWSILRGKSELSMEIDNRDILILTTVQLIIGVAVINFNFEYISLLDTFIVLIILCCLVLLSQRLPEIVHRLNVQYSVSAGNSGDVSSFGREGKQRKVRYIFTYIVFVSTSLIGLFGVSYFVGSIPLTPMYLVLFMSFMAVLISRWDSEMFEEKHETGRETHLLMFLITSTGIFGLGVSEYLSSIRPLIPPEILVGVGGAGTVVAILGLVYEYKLKQSFR